jgi:hypothetical protein
MLCWISGVLAQRGESFLGGMTETGLPRLVVVVQEAHVAASINSPAASRGCAQRAQARDAPQPGAPSASSPARRRNGANMAVVKGSLDRSVGGLAFQMR